MRIFILLLADRLPFFCLSTLVDTPLLASIFIWACSFSLSTLVDVPLQLHYMIKHWFQHLSTFVDTAFISSRHLYERHHLNLSTLVDTSLLFALHIRILILVFVHFSRRSLAILDIYLRALSQFAHFSGHPSFSCITWWSAGFNACPLLWTPPIYHHGIYFDTLA